MSIVFYVVFFCLHTFTSTANTFLFQHQSTTSITWTSTKHVWLSCIYELWNALLWQINFVVFQGKIILAKLSKNCFSQGKVTFLSMSFKGFFLNQWKCLSKVFQLASAWGVCTALQSQSFLRKVEYFMQLRIPIAFPTRSMLFIFFFSEEENNKTLQWRVGVSWFTLYIIWKLH